MNPKKATIKTVTYTNPTKKNTTTKITITNPLPKPEQLIN